MTPSPASPVPLLLRAAWFAAEKHRNQRRKDAHATPYINHPLRVAYTLASVGQVQDPALLAAALLHDTVEDTETTAEELEKAFGAEVRSLVGEVTDDKSLPKETRKRLRVERAAGLSVSARQMKLADMICNLSDLCVHKPAQWTDERAAEYVRWARAVADGCRGVNPALDAEFDRVHAAAHGAYPSPAR